MQKSKFFFILGTRPEVIKLSPIIIALQQRDEAVYVINTGQQEKLTSEFLQEFSIQTSHTFRLPHRRSLNSNFGSMVKAIDKILKTERGSSPVIFVQGDTTSALSGAFAGFNLGIPVFHVEAGLRSGDRFAPFPEEVYRTLITQLASHHFAPTETAYSNLVKSGIDHNSITLCGNTGIDTLVTLTKHTKRKAVKNRKNLLVTLHRRENFGSTINRITAMLHELTNEMPNILINFIYHTNPEVTNSYDKDFNKNPSIAKHNPQSYKKMIELLGEADIIITDSGGLQEESAYLGIPLIVARDVTERREVLSSNCALCTTNTNRIKQTLIKLLKDESELKQFTKQTTIFGKGDSASIILEKLLGMGFINTTTK
jgi:UDP-N-acetylglucosamine 2-epimerase (non-hydrolysing)